MKVESHSVVVAFSATPKKSYKLISNHGGLCSSFLLGMSSISFSFILALESLTGKVPISKPIIPINVGYSTKLIPWRIELKIQLKT